MAKIKGKLIEGNKTGPIVYTTIKNDPKSYEYVAKSTPLKRKKRKL